MPTIILARHTSLQHTKNHTPKPSSCCASLRFLGSLQFSKPLSDIETVHELLHHPQLCAVLGGVQDEDILID